MTDGRPDATDTPESDFMPAQPHPLQTSSKRITIDQESISTIGAHSMVTGSLRVNRDIILSTKQHRLRERQRTTPREAILALAEMTPTPPGVLNTVSVDGHLTLIAQVTRTETYDPVSIALISKREGLDAVSFFTDHSIYEHDYDDLLMVTRGIKEMPAIFQNYVFSEYGVISARASGAAAIMLYASVLDADTLRQLVSQTQRWRMAALVQVANQADMEYALSLSPHAVCYGDPAQPSGQRPAMLELRRLRESVPLHTKILPAHPLSNLADVQMALDVGVHGIFLSQDLLQNTRDLEALRRMTDH